MDALRFLEIDFFVYNVTLRPGYKFITGAILEIHKYISFVLLYKFLSSFGLADAWKSIFNPVLVLLELASHWFFQ